MFYEVGVVVDPYKQLKETTKEIKVSRERANLSAGLITKSGIEGKSLTNTERRNKWGGGLAHGSVSMLAIKNLNMMIHMLWKDGMFMWFSHFIITSNRGKYN